MDIDDYEPQPDIILACKDDEVPAHSPILLIASAPLRPAIVMALRNTESHDSEQLVRVNLPEDDGSAWRIALTFLDPNMVTPAIQWATVEKLLRVAHKYSLKVPLDRCVAFLEEVYGSALLSSPLIGDQELYLASLRHWVTVSSDLGLAGLHKLTSTALATNLVNTLMYSRQANKQGYCSYGGGKMCNPGSGCKHCKEQHSLACFRLIWATSTPLQGGLGAEAAAAALKGFGDQELRHMMVAVLMSAL